MRSLPALNQESMSTILAALPVSKFKTLVPRSLVGPAYNAVKSGLAPASKIDFTHLTATLVHRNVGFRPKRTSRMIGYGMDHDKVRELLLAQQGIGTSSASRQTAVMARC